MYVNFETIGYVYILASKMAGTLYIGITSDVENVLANIGKALAANSPQNMKFIGWFITKNLAP